MVNDAKQEQKKEILRKIEISKNQKLLLYDNLYNFVIKLVKTNIQIYVLKKRFQDYHCESGIIIFARRVT